MSGMATRMFGSSDATYEPLPSEDQACHISDTSDHVDEVAENVPSDSGQADHSCCEFVESMWFQLLTVGVIMINFILMVMKMKHPDLKSILQTPEEVLLSFYVFELQSKLMYHRANFICGQFHSVAWNVLDGVIVVAGVLDEWVLPRLPGNGGPRLQDILKIFRCLRLIRLLKIVRIFLETDLSWCESPKFQSFIGVVIAFNSALMGMETDIHWEGWLLIEQVFLTIYVFELTASLKRFGSFFFSCENADIVWNVLDFVIVVSSGIDSWVIPIIQLIKDFLLTSEQVAKHKDEQSGMSLGEAMMLMRMMRLMRVLRLIKLVKSIRPLYILITSVLAALQGVAWVLVLTLVVLYAMGIASTRLIGQKMLFPEDALITNAVLQPFRTVPDSMFTLFRVMSGAASEEESTAIDELMVKLPTVKFAFVFFMITSSWTLLSILTAVVSENMISTTGEQEYEMKLASDEEDRAQHIQELQELFGTIDVSGDGTVDELELIRFLGVRENAVRATRCCRAPVRDIKSVFNDLLVQHGDVDMQTFTTCLADVGKPVTHESVLRLSAKVQNLQARGEQLHKVHLCGSSLPEKTLKIKRSATLPSFSDHGIEKPAKDTMLDQYEGWPGMIQAHVQTMEQFRMQAETSKEILCAVKHLSTQIGDLASCVQRSIPLSTMPHQPPEYTGSLIGTAKSSMDTSDSNTVPDDVLVASPGQCRVASGVVQGLVETAESNVREVAASDIIASQNLFLETMQIQLDKLVESITLNLASSTTKPNLGTTASLHDPALKLDQLTATKTTGEPAARANVESVFVSRAKPKHNGKEPTLECIRATSPRSPRSLYSRSASISPPRNSHACSNRLSFSPRARTAR